MIANRREHFREGLSVLYQAKYDLLCSKLGPEWQPYSSLRNFDQQNQLWAQGRSKSGGIVTNAKGGESAHNYGCASDWTKWDANGNPIWLKKDAPDWQEYIKAVEDSGLRPGVEFGDIDHNELKISCDWPTILVFYNQNGMTAAQQAIEERMC